VRHGDEWLALNAADAIGTWQREDGSMGTLELTEAGTIARRNNDEEEMDMAANNGRGS
jgi:hypothetical protein